MQCRILAAALMLFVPLVSVYAQQAPAPQDPAVACSRTLVAEPRFASIASKLPLANVLDISFEMLANESFPTPQERKAIAAWVPAHKECSKAGEAYRQQNYPPQLIAFLTEADNSGIVVVAELYNKKLTYGAANKRIQSIADDLRNKVAALVQQIQSQRAGEQQALQKAQEDQQATQKRDEAAQQASHQRDEIARQAAQQQYEQAREDQELAARRQAALQFMLNNMRATQPAPIVPYQIPIRPTTTTNCYRVGNQMNCTTQ
jgi:hypothetical protein